MNGALLRDVRTTKTTDELVTVPAIIVTGIQQICHGPANATGTTTNHNQSTGGYYQANFQVLNNHLLSIM